MGGDGFASSMLEFDMRNDTWIVRTIEDWISAGPVPCVGIGGAFHGDLYIQDELVMGTLKEKLVSDTNEAGKLLDSLILPLWIVGVFCLIVCVMCFMGGIFSCRK